MPEPAARPLVDAPHERPARRALRTARPPAAFTRPRAAAGGATILALALAACGGSSGGATTGAAPAANPGGRGFGIAQDPKVAACLRARGVMPPSRPPAGVRPGGEAPGSGGGRRGGFGGQSATQRTKLMQALAACGVRLPPGRPGRGVPGSGAPGGEAPGGRAPGGGAPGGEAPGGRAPGGGSATPATPAAPAAPAGAASS